MFLETDDSGIIMVLILPSDEHKSLKDFATHYSKTTNQQILMGSFKSQGFNDIKAKTKHTGIEEKLTLNICDEDVPMTRQYFSFNNTDKTVYIIIQIDNEELDDLSGLEKVLSTFEFVKKS